MQGSMESEPLLQQDLVLQHLPFPLRFPAARLDHARQCHLSVLARQGYQPRLVAQGSLLSRHHRVPLAAQENQYPHFRLFLRGVLEDHLFHLFQVYQVHQQDQEHLGRRPHQRALLGQLGLLDQCLLLHRSPPFHPYLLLAQGVQEILDRLEDLALQADQADLQLLQLHLGQLSQQGQHLLVLPSLLEDLGGRQAQPLPVHQHHPSLQGFLVVPARLVHLLDLVDLLQSQLHQELLPRQAQEAQVPQ
mmetsp:Transcript_33036/g.69067  ORF Transcript_33036/g.69067 Transcript_33036/m.69067 type:complete len:247 (+) Transcript_33036:1193-1933(+)